MSEPHYALCVAILKNCIPERAFALLEDPNDKRKYITPDDEKDMIVLYLQGETLKEIGGIYGIGQSAVFKRMKKNGVRREADAAKSD